MKKQIKLITLLPILALPLLFAGCGKQEKHHTQPWKGIMASLTPDKKTRPWTPITPPKNKLTPLTPVNQYQWINNTINKDWKNALNNAKESGFDPTKDYTVSNFKWALTNYYYKTHYALYNFTFSVQIEQTTLNPDGSVTYFNEIFQHNQRALPYTIIYFGSKIELDTLSWDQNAFTFQQ